MTDWYQKAEEDLEQSRRIQEEYSGDTCGWVASEPDEAEKKRLRRKFLRVINKTRIEIEVVLQDARKQGFIISGAEITEHNPHIKEDLEGIGVYSNFPIIKTWSRENRGVDTGINIANVTLKIVWKITEPRYGYQKYLYLGVIKTDDPFIWFEKRKYKPSITAEEVEWALEDWVHNIVKEGY